MTTYIPPSLGTKAFTCPHCGAIASQAWNSRTPLFAQYDDPSRDVISTAHCNHCRRYTLWHEGTMVHPLSGNAPPANPDMPASVIKTYQEAASISNLSPRGAAGLLRLGIQTLCKELGEPGKNINDDIGALVKKGLPANVQKSLDIVRVIGNNAVHPGQIDTDDPEIVSTLFGLTNVICEYMITLPKRVDGIYTGLPAGSLDAISKRDAKKT